MDAFLHRSFVKKFKKLAPKIQKQFGERLDLFLTNPTDQILNNHSVERAFPDCRSINITGDFRAVYWQIDDDLVEFVVIDTHTNLYE